MSRYKDGKMTTGQCVIATTAIGGTIGGSIYVANMLVNAAAALPAGTTFAYPYVICGAKLVTIGGAAAAGTVVAAPVALCAAGAAAVGSLCYGFYRWFK